MPGIFELPCAVCLKPFLLLSREGRIVCDEGFHVLILQAV